MIGEPLEVPPSSTFAWLDGGRVRWSPSAHTRHGPAIKQRRLRETIADLKRSLTDWIDMRAAARRASRRSRSTHVSTQANGNTVGDNLSNAGRIVSPRVWRYRRPETGVVRRVKRAYRCSFVEGPTAGVGRTPAAAPATNGDHMGDEAPRPQPDPGAPGKKHLRATRAGLTGTRTLKDRTASADQRACLEDPHDRDEASSTVGF